jgi:hypothetical protein
MSKAGIQSNRGDGYQTLVAFDWALSVLSDPDYQWLEVDSVSWAVDDVVIGKADGILICCQCKKNQTEHKAWSIADLAEELRKAIRLLTNTASADVRFYSRSSFGDIAALREYSSIYVDELSYQNNLVGGDKEVNKNKTTDNKLAQLLSAEKSTLTTYQFLQRTRFEVSPDLDRMRSLLHERLRSLVSNESAAYDTLWTHLDHLGFRERADGESASPRHQLTKDDLINLLSKAGSILTPPVDIQQIRTSFKSTSAIGRSWRKDIGGVQIPSPVVNKLIDAIKAKNRSILLTGSPGAGKTCVMLALQDELERQAQSCNDLIPLFIQSREFADLTSVHERQAQGLSENWVEKAARLADDAHVVVIIDSLDVLSIAREHSVLTYFLAQIERLLLIPSITVVTACRDFDLQYDRRIAQCSWDTKVACPPLSWDTEIIPLLTTFEIDPSTIDAPTRELIRNPRELALFVELAQQGGSFNVVTSQALAQRYLTTIVLRNLALGDVAMQAIEDMAAEMLQRRSMAVQQQRFIASDTIKRALLSNNVLHEARDGQLMFGHQTLLDVLVISHAIRQRETLNSFILQLPPVPFVRPSIRSFVMQLAAGDRFEFRKQLRTVLTGTTAFHIRRLVAETFVEQLPDEGFWPLIRDLYVQHREVFQVIYTQAVRVEWHYFWMRHLIPFLKSASDIDGLTRHMHRIAQWKNDDAVGVVKFWTEMLAFNGVDKARVADSISLSLADIHEEHLAACASLVFELLKSARQEHSFIGRVIARCVLSGHLDDTVLWNYIVGEVCDGDVYGHDFNDKLRCQSHNFGGGHDTFLADRMRESAELLDLAITSIEHWSKIKNSRYREASLRFCSEFLRDTSFGDEHSQGSLGHYSGPVSVVLDVIESAVLHHARTQSFWWQNNRERLCFNPEGALRYFAVLACVETAKANIDIIARMLSDKELLEHDPSFELGSLIRNAFLLLSTEDQVAIQATILSLYDNCSEHKTWIPQEQAQLILSIPCYLRTPESEKILFECEKTIWPLTRKPHIYSRGGIVGAPFNYEIFWQLSDESVMHLLVHYNGHHRDSVEDFLVGGEREVADQLREAASRSPTRYLNLLKNGWENIPACFYDDIMHGVVRYLAHRYGNLQINGDWVPHEEPDAALLAQQILNELENHSNYWRCNREAGRALNSCAYVVKELPDTTRLVFLVMDFSILQAESLISGDSVNLLSHGFSMGKGNAAEALIILANKLAENDISWPGSLPDALRLFAADEHPAVRALLLQRMRYLQHHYPEFGWELFGVAMGKSDPGLWELAEPCLYYAYHKAFEIVSPWLERLYCEGSGKDLEVWGRISALAVLSKKMDISTLLEELIARESAEAWGGAASVWTHASNLKQHSELCIAGLEVGLGAENAHTLVVARKFPNIFREINPPISVSIDLIRRYFCLIESNIHSSTNDVRGFAAWLNAISLYSPSYALDACEIYFDFVKHKNCSVSNFEKNLTQLLTRLFTQAEEQEESDSGAMLQRVVVLQDILLALDVHGVGDWLKAAERN